MWGLIFIISITGLKIPDGWNSELPGRIDTFRKIKVKGLSDLKKCPPCKKLWIFEFLLSRLISFFTRTEKLSTLHYNFWRSMSFKLRRMGGKIQNCVNNNNDSLVLKILVNHRSTHRKYLVGHYLVPHWHM